MGFKYGRLVTSAQIEPGTFETPAGAQSKADAARALAEVAAAAHANAAAAQAKADALAEAADHADVAAAAAALAAQTAAAAHADAVAAQAAADALAAAGDHAAAEAAQARADAIAAAAADATAKADAARAAAIAEAVALADDAYERARDPAWWKGGVIPGDIVIASPGYVPGLSGWALDGQGNLEANAAILRAATVVGGQTRRVQITPADGVRIYGLNFGPSSLLATLDRTGLWVSPSPGSAVRVGDYTALSEDMLVLRAAARGPFPEPETAILKATTQSGDQHAALAIKAPGIFLDGAVSHRPTGQGDGREMRSLDGAKVGRSAAHALAAATFVNVAWTVQDTTMPEGLGWAWSQGSGIRVPRAGRYRVGLRALFQAGPGTAYRQIIRVTVNGQGNLRTPRHDHNGNNGYVIDTSDVLALQANDWVNGQAYAASAAEVTGTYLDVQYLGPID